MIKLPREVCVDLDQALHKEWLVANGIGGYASGTITGINTRRYHGLLVAALTPPVSRTVLLSNIDEQVDIDDRTYYLGANEYPGDKINPAGYVHIEEFSLQDGLAVTIFRMGDSLLHKTVWMEHGHNTTYVQYKYAEGQDECCLLLNTMCNYRDYHSTTEGNLDRDFGVEPVAGGCKIMSQPDAQPFWLTSSPQAEFTHTGVWYWNFVYQEDKARGYEDNDDLYLPGVFRFTLQPGETVTLVASTEPPEATSPSIEGAMEREQARQEALLKAAGVKPGIAAADAGDPGASDEAFAAQLVVAAYTFMVTRKVSRGGDTSEVPSVLAGYHWFTDWGRDTMISLPGLSLPTGRTREAGKVLQTFGLFSKEGLIPNHFPDSGEAPEYNSADATLWMFAAAEALAMGKGSITVARNLYPLLADVIAWHIRGTRYGIKADPLDGLLTAGQEGVQLTWMDAKVDGWVVTPRRGKPVEVNALWYNALIVMDRLRIYLGPTVVRGREEPPDFNSLSQQVRNSFRRRFWYDAEGYLFDVIDGPDGNDTSIRPNQIFAASLRNDLLSIDQARQVLATVRKHLLTPYGLRTLAPEDPGYKGKYAGNTHERDAAYHNGTVWAWLLGPYFDAVSHIEGEEAADVELRKMLPTLRAHLADAGLGSISETFDGDAPHEPGGCISQAWSVAEILRHVRGVRG